MKRSMMGVYVKGSKEAVALYQKAFDAELISSYLNEDGSYYHSELNVYGQILAVSESADNDYDDGKTRVTGNVMQFCLHFGVEEEALLRRAVDILKEGAKILYPLGPTDWSSLMTDFIDRFGVRWCIFED